MRGRVKIIFLCILVLLGGAFAEETKQERSASNQDDGIYLEDEGSGDVGRWNSREESHRGHDDEDASGSGGGMIGGDDEDDHPRKTAEETPKQHTPKHEEEDEVKFDESEPENNPVETVTQPPPSDTNGAGDIMGHKEKVDHASFFRQPGILAAVIGGAIVGLLCAILLVMFIVYRMRKKDEGSYPLEEQKRAPTNYSYGKNSREFYA